MNKILKEIQYDLNFLRSHTLQPGWFKILKVFLLAGFLVGYGLLFGIQKTALFLSIFLSLSLFIHFLYRVKTHKYTRSWLDFTIANTHNGGRPSRIGPYYYLAIVINTVSSLIISQLI